MSLGLSKLELEIGDALKTDSTKPSRTGWGTWVLKCGSNGSENAECRLRDGWLVLRQPLQQGTKEFDLWELLLSGGRVRGNSKVILRPSDRKLFLGADLPVDDVEIKAVLKSCRNAVSALAEANEVIEHIQNGSAPVTRRGSTKKRRDLSAELRELCEEAGRPFSERDDGRLMIELKDVTQGYYQAALEARSKRDYRTSVQMARYQSPSGEVQRALAVFCLNANGTIRFARAALNKNEDGLSSLFEVRFSGRPSVVMLNHALAALSAACSYCGQELRVLGDETTARKFLGVRGMHAPSGCSAKRAPNSRTHRT
jgi:hypothetical protein